LASTKNGVYESDYARELVDREQMSTNVAINDAIEFNDEIYIASNDGIKKIINDTIRDVFQGQKVFSFSKDENNLYFSTISGNKI
jgi:hypothetical protein